MHFTLSENMWEDDKLGLLDTSRQFKTLQEVVDYAKTTPYQPHWISVTEHDEDNLDGYGCPENTGSMSLEEVMHEIEKDPNFNSIPG